MGAPAAPAMTATMASKAAAARRLRLTVRPSASLIPDPRVEIRVEDVHGQVHEHEGARDHEHAPLHEGDIARQDALDHERPHSGPGEHGFRQHRAAEQIAGLDADHGDDRDERVLERVAHDHRPFGRALGARGPDVVLAEHLEHGAAREPRDDRDRGGREGERGEQEMSEEVARAAAAVGANIPEAGSQPSHSEKITISTMPSQKTGMLAPKSEATALSRSSREFARVAEAMPSAMPPTVERRRALAVRSSVALNRPITSASTGRFIQSERPRSPRRTWLIQWKYWTWSGWSRPSSARSRDRSS